MRRTKLDQSRAGERAGTLGASLKAVIIGAAMALVAGASIAAPVDSDWAKVTVVSGGWTAATIRLQTNGAFFNPNACLMTDGYVIEASLPGAQLFASMVLTGLSTLQDIKLTIDGCALDRPRVVGVVLRRST